MTADDPLAAANDRRHGEAARRDAGLARRIMAVRAVWAILDATQRRITEARAADPAETWAQIGGRLRIGKDAAFHTWRRMLAYPQLTRLKEAPMEPDPVPDPDSPVLDWADITAALEAAGCDDDETRAAVAAGDLIIVVPSVGVAMMFAAQLAIRLTGGDMAGGAAALVHTTAEVEEILARISDGWLPWPGELPALEIAFPGVTITGVPDDAVLPECRRCGCTELRACPGGCGWAEPGLCTTCAADGQMAAGQ